ncbi:alpha/beta fold hydrolase [Actinoplanes sp. NPDC049265]|uniref:alpha/beta fold hydrolase n=1 Tax=Actinoplanes sp. NPDC049265 TaxID=3363902 RepID=UPI00371D10EE
MSGPAAGPRSPQMEALCRLFAEVLGVDRVGVDDDFFGAGGNSLDVVRLVGRIRVTFGVRIGTDAVFRHPTVRGVAGQLSIDSQGEDSLDPVLVLRPHGGLPPLFCVHPGGGMSWCYTGLLGVLDADRPVMALQARGLRTGDTLVQGGVGAMADDFLTLIREVQPEGPYHLLGWSFGGTLAHAIAARMQEAGQKVGMLAVMDAEPTAAEGPERTPTVRELLISLLQEFGYDLRDIANVPLRPDRVIALLRRENSAMAYVEPATVNAVMEVYANNLRAVSGHRPPLFHGDLEFFYAAEEPAVDAGRWSPFVTGEIRPHPLACTHRTIAQPGPMAAIARVLDDLLG